jgi:hypothetical protein
MTNTMQKECSHADVALHVSDCCICQSTVKDLLKSNLYKACLHASCLSTHHAVCAQLHSAELEI